MFETTKTFIVDPGDDTTCIECGWRNSSGMKFYCPIYGDIDTNDDDEPLRRQECLDDEKRSGKEK